MAISYHEPASELPIEVREMHRAIASLVEELEAVDWYHQRAEITADAQLRGVLIHNRDEEIEHVCMLLEWLRRRVPKFDEELRTYLYTSAPITQVEGAAENSEEPEAEGDVTADLGIGKLDV